MEADSPIRDIAEKALDAFWDAVGREYPDAKTGDLTPQTTTALDHLAQSAIAEWVIFNAPDTPAPGPWRFTVSQNPDVYRGEEHFAVIADHKTSHGQILADVENLPGAKANAALMAAAPDLLDALQDVNLSLTDLYGDERRIAGEYFGAALHERIEAAIANAERR